MKPLVVIVHTEHGLQRQVIASVVEQWSHYKLQLTSSRNPFAYGDVLRTLWRWPGEFVLVEQDVVPPPGAIAQLFTCDMPWCTHPHWMGDHYGTSTTGLVRWSLGLRENLPALMDVVCSQTDPRYWVRRGWTRIARDCSVATLNKSGRKATLTVNAPIDDWIRSPRTRPTTHDWHGIDADVAKQLHAVGIMPHVHPTPTKHLHDYEKVPPGSYVPWHQRPFDPEEWPD